MPVAPVEPTWYVFHHLFSHITYCYRHFPCIFSRHHFTTSATFAQRLRLMCPCFPGYTRHTEIRFEPESSLHPTPPLAPPLPPYPTRYYNIYADSTLGLATARPATRGGAGGAGDRVSNLRQEQQPASPLVRRRQRQRQRRRQQQRQRQIIPAAAVTLSPLTHSVSQDRFVAHFGAGARGRVDPKITPPRKLQL
jgi:hypothetical protein